MTDARAAEDELVNMREVQFVVFPRERLDDAVEQLRQQSFDAVLLDFTLPDSSKRICDRLHEAAPSAPVVVLPNWADEPASAQVSNTPAKRHPNLAQVCQRILVRAIEYASERALLEQAVRESEERFRATFEQAAVGIAHVNLDGQFIRVNGKLCEITGYPREDLLKLTISALTVWEDRNEGEKALTAMIEGRLSSNSVEQRYRRPNGQVYWVNVVTTLARDGAGEPQYFLAVTQEITRRKAEELRIKEAEERYRAVFDRSLDAVYLCSLDGRFLDANPAALNLFGYSKEEIPSLDFSSLVTSQSDFERAHRSLAELIATGSQKGTEEYKLKRKDGSSVWVELLSSLVHRGGRPNAVQGIARDISARKEAEVALADSEAKFRAIFEHAGLGLAIVDCESGNIQHCNEALAQMLGYTIIDLCGMTVETVSHPDDYAKDREQWKKMVDDKSARFQMEKRYRCRDGREMWGLLTTTVVRDAQENPRFLIGMVEDITTRKNAEAALRSSEARFRAIFEQAGIGIAIVHWEDGQIQQSNEALARMLGYSTAELSRLTIEDISWPEQSVRTWKQWRDMIAANSPRFQMEKRYLHKGGKAVWSLLTNTVVRNEAGEPKFVIGMVEDITKRRAAHEQLEQSAALLRIAGKVARLGAWTIELPEHKLTWSDETCLIHERTPGYQPTLEEGLSMFPAEHQSEVQHHVNACEKDGTPYDFEVPKITAKGRRIWVRCIGEAVRDEAGRIIRLQGAFQDVTERKKLEEQFLRAQRMESIGTLAGGIAHDLNNVLAPIIMSIQLLKMDETHQDRLNLLAMIESNANRGADMVRQVLSFARGIEGRRIELQLRHLLRDIKKIADETFPKNITVQTEVSKTLWTVSGDPTQIHQVLLNLSVNARDAMPDGGKITLSAQNVHLDQHYSSLDPEVLPGHYVVIEIEDTGTGIPPEIIDRIWDPFFTTKEVGKGTGLGLSTSLAIVKSHRGFIKVASQPGKGSTFRIHLPAQNKAPSETQHLSRPDLPRGNGELILVVDDEAAVRQITRQTLEAFGYSVVLAADGAEAIATYASRKDEIAVVLTDIMMPVMGGHVVMAVLSRINPKVRIIATSGQNFSGEIAGSTEQIRHFLPKPYSADVLLKKLREVVQGK